MLMLLGYNEAEIGALRFNDIIADDNFKDKTHTFSDLLSLFSSPKQFESKLKRKDSSIVDVLLSISNISLAGSDAIILLTRELKVPMSGEGIIGSSKSHAGRTADKSGIGVFRTTLARKSMFVEANETAIRIFTGVAENNLFGTNIEDFFADDEERRTLVKELISRGFAQRRFLKIVRTNKTICYVRVALSVVTEPGADVKYCDGIIEDVTILRDAENARERITEELQASVVWMDLPVSDCCELNPMTCGLYVSVKKAAALLGENAGSALLIEDTKGQAIGMVTDAELSRFVTMDAFNAEVPVYKIMQSPLWEIPAHTSLFDAFQLFTKNKLSHIIVRLGGENNRGILTATSFVSSLKNTTGLIRNEIATASSTDELKAAQERMKQSVLVSLNLGLNPENLTRIIAETSESIIKKLNDLAIEELGPPPAPYAFITLGSVGRSEQTLATDQDNAIIFADVPKENEETVRNYFLLMGTLICRQLDAIGYDFCKGKIMAQNPKFCQPLRTWKMYFTDWVNTVEPQDLLDANIFFDFKYSYGEKSFCDELKQHLRYITENNNVFFYHLAMNTLSLKTPIGFFGNIIKDSKEQHPDAFDIKKAIMPIIGFARIYGLKNHIDENNTLVRLNALTDLEVLTKAEYLQLKQMYTYLMTLRFRHQTALIKEGLAPDNYVKPGMLTELDNAILKKIFSMTNLVQTKLNFDFKGTAS
jgi:CBS domain-containing protein